MKVRHIEIANNKPLVLIAGPCQIETPEHTLWLAEKLDKICSNVGVDLIFKASYDKANRTSLSGKRGVGLRRGLEALQAVRRMGIPVTTDVHSPGQCGAVMNDVDMIQIPAFLCRQTDLLVAAGTTQRPVNIKKGQFMAPTAMVHAAGKVASTGNNQIMLTERGTTFGHGDLVVDMRGLQTMQVSNHPVCFDATHSTQKPSGNGASSGGEGYHAGTLAKAAVATGIAALFMEVHEEPARAPSDGDVMLPLAHLYDLLSTLRDIDRATKHLS